MPQTPKILNLGCGRRFHPDHTNLDFVSSAPQVQQHDLTTGIPFPDNSFDAVYHSHVLEHFDREGGEAFLAECRRVLKPGGRVRIAVPDLESIVIEYQAALSACRSGSPTAPEAHEWALLELYDQFSRNRSGGAIRTYLTTKDAATLQYPISRLGFEARRLLNPAPNTQQSTRANLASKAYTKAAKSLIELISWILLGRRGKSAFTIGWFRTSGEVHQCMYDEILLNITLLKVGFILPTRFMHNNSGISNWIDYGLDSEPDGTAYKPDSLFVEASKESTKFA